MKLIIALLALCMLAGAALATSQSVPINVTVDKYAFAYFPVTADLGANHDLYGALIANDKEAFNITIPAGQTSGTDTVNMVWGCNTPTRITIGFTKGTLPGTWTMEFDGAGVTPPNQAFDTEAKDCGVLLAVPIKLNVTGVDYTNTKAGSYSGSLNIVSVIPL